MRPSVKVSARQDGFSLIEALVTLLILLLGLLGLAGLIRQSQTSEMESYQRVQALVLLKDMAERINANRGSASSYVTGTTAPLGTSSTKNCSAPTALSDIDLCQWDAALKGAAEVSGTSTVGAMLGGRGCVSSPSANQYLVQVVWQGLAATAIPPASLLCGQGSYGDDKNRRAVALVVQIGTISP